jgi:hypothetical protein
VAGLSHRDPGVLYLKGEIGEPLAGFKQGNKIMLQEHQSGFSVKDVGIGDHSGGLEIGCCNSF